ncbi:hypothetical protein BSP36_080 [Bacillus phage BSP36]|nr:hypothetical protein BSP36_080 [Bacillus phage BSP36]
MSITFTEREALELKMKYILEERTRLDDQFNFCLERLRELDELDNIHPNSKVENKKVEIKVADGESVMSLEEACNKHTDVHHSGDSKEITEKAEKVEKSPVATSVVTKRVGKARDSHYRDVKKLSYQVASILKEAGKPMKVAEIMKKLDKAGVSTHAPYALMNSVTKYQPKIIKAGGFGYYQYKW